MPDHPATPILHADLDAFYASVEQRDSPRLRGRPVIVGGGVVLAASYEARRFGVRTAMSGREARLLCPGAVTVEPRMDAYSEASKEVFAIFHDTTPMVEGISIDEAFLDVGGLFRLVGPPRQVAATLRQRVAEEVGLVLTVGAARTKFLAKVASGVAKPDGLLIVPPNGEVDFLHPLPVNKLWGVGPKTTEKLAARSLHTVADVAALDRGALVALVGQGVGHKLHALARNRDPRPVEVGRRRRSMGSQRALGRHPRTMTELQAILNGLVDRVAERLRKANRVASTVTLRLRFHDLATRATRSRTLPEATSDTQPLQGAARGLLTDSEPLIDANGITLLGITLSGLSDTNAVQLGLPFDQGRGEALDTALDGVRQRFGSRSVGRAALVGHRTMEMPSLPEPHREEANRPS
ncbi:MAG: DNA polymerase IV [Actinomycetia bacterium]|nr:DNA polymerase IV [Actinomycetes bacterium]